jgi:two-component system response regulator AlgR
LKSLETEFGGRFLRIHRNALVAVAHVAGLRKTSAGHFQVLLHGSAAPLEVSRRHLAGVRRFIREL